MALSDGLVAYWEFENDATDSTGSYDLTEVGTIAYGTGVVGDCFDNGGAGGNNYFTLDNHMGISATGAISLAGWTKFNTALSGSNGPDWTIIRRYTDANGSGLGWIHEYNGGSPRLRVIRFGTSNYIADYSYTPSVGTWFHVVVTYDGTNVTTYLNGSSILGPTSNTGTQNTAGFKLAIGSYAGTSSEEKYWALDQFGIWNKELDSTEVSDLYNGGSGLSYADIIGGSAQTYASPSGGVAYSGGSTMY